jgi:hypothetical protein
MYRCPGMTNGGPFSIRVPPTSTRPPIKVMRIWLLPAVGRTHCVTSMTYSVKRAVPLGVYHGL